MPDDQGTVAECECASEIVACGTFQYQRSSSALRKGSIRRISIQSAEYYGPSVYGECSVATPNDRPTAET